jgi:hypothetical protein
MQIVLYDRTAHLDVVQRFNATLGGDIEFKLPTHEPCWHTSGSPVWAEQFVAADEEMAYGGYCLKHQEFFVDGEALELGNLQLPLSLGLVDSKFSHVSAALVFDALDRSPYLYCLGMGSQESRLVGVLRAAGWQHMVVPFYFRVRHANRFACEIHLPAEKRRLQAGLRMLGFLRLAGAALRLHPRVRMSASATPAGETEVVPTFGPFADELFADHASEYALVGDRRADALNVLYPEDNPRYIRLVVRSGGRIIGWCVVLDTQMNGHKYFGSLHVGTVADCFAGAEHAPTVAASADKFLSRRGVDLIVTNQAHRAWGACLEQLGYGLGPSNFFFYYSPDTAEILSKRPDWQRRMHINRGDGDGPIHL